jgi:hypothetical protein
LFSQRTYYALRSLAAFASFVLAVSPLAAMADGMSDPLYERTSGAWSIGGYVMGVGNTAACRLTRPASDGTTFGYVTMLSAGTDGMKAMALFTVPIDLPDGTQIVMSMSFDGKAPIMLAGGISSGFLHADLPDDITQMQRVVDTFRSSRLVSLRIIANAVSVKSEQVDLAGSGQAFEENGICMSTMVHVGIERMKNHNAGRER